MLVGVVGKNKTQTCQLQVTLKDTVYHRVKGQLVTLTQEELKRREANELAHDADLAPADTDDAHYPLRLAHF